jgi:hypothetical protein
MIVFSRPATASMARSQPPRRDLDDTRALHRLTAATFVVGRLSHR